MKAITDEVYASVLNVLGQLPMNQVEQLVVGVRSAVDIPKPIAEDIKRMSKLRVQTALQKQLAQLGTVTPPGQQPPAGQATTPPNGQGDNPPA